MDDNDEVLDLVDKKDNIIGTILRSQIDMTSHVGYVRAAEAFIQNSDGKLWIPRRSSNKRIAPNGLDYSMGEHVKSGEDYLSACIRGFSEELNINLTKTDLKFINKFSPTVNLGYFRTLHLYRSDKVPQFNPQDFSEYFWLTPNELLDRLKGGELAKSSLIETVSYLINN